MANFHPYLFFVGNCREAMTRYQEVLGGELVLLTAADMPGEEAMPGAPADAIMHAALKIGDGLLMASDDPTVDEAGPKQGMRVNYSVSEDDEASRVFAALADGGEVELPIGPTSWSPMFGMCTDRFGTPWMISADPPATG